MKLGRAAPPADLFATQTIGTGALPSGPVEMLSPTGERQSVAPRHAETLRALGYRDITPEVQQEIEDRAKYGGTLGEVGAAGLGFVRGATLGASDLLARAAEHAGVLPAGTTDDIRKLKEFNPTASLGGELASFVVPALGSVKALGAAGAAARGLGAAQSAVGAVGTTLGKVATKVVGEQIGKLAAPAVKMAAEAAIFQAGQNISEAALNDKELTAEAVLAHTGEAAILGGGLGLALPLGLRAAKNVAATVADTAPARWVMDQAHRRLAKFMDPQHALQIYSGAEGRSALLMDTGKGKKFKEGIKTLWGEGAYKGGEVAVDDATGKLVQTAEGGLLNRADMAQRFSTLEKESGRIIGDTLEKADDLIRERGARPQAFGFRNADADKVIDKIAKFSSSSRINDVQELALVQQLEQDALRIRDAAKFGELHEIRRALDARITDKGFEAIGKPAQEITKDVRRIVADKIRDGLQEVSPALLERWNNSNKLFGALKTVGDALQRQVARADANVNVLGLRFRDIGIGAIAGGVGGGPFGVAAAMANRALQTDQGLLARAVVGEKLAALGWMQKATDTAQKSISKSVSGFLKGIDTDAIARVALRPPAIGAGPSALIAMTTPEQRRDDGQDWFAKASKQIIDIVSDPERFADLQEQQIAALTDNAPNTTDTIVMKQLQIYQYLASVMPKNPGNPMSILAPQWRPSEHEIEQFRDVVNVAQKPLSVLQNMRNGTVTRAQMQAVQALYPSLYRQMFTDVQQQLTKHATTLTYEQRLRLGALFPGAEPTMSGDFVAAMSSTPAEAETKQDSQTYRPGGASKMTTGSRYETKLDNLARR